MKKARADSDQNVGELARVLAIIYGFFFVFLSAFLGSVPWIMTLDVDLRIKAYVLLWLMSFSVILIGSALASILEDLGLGILGGIGLFALNASMLLSYLFFVGDVIAIDVIFADWELRVLGPISFFISIVIVVAVLVFRRRRRIKELEDFFDEIRVREEVAPFLAQMIPEAENPEAILRLLENLKKYPYIATDDGVRSAIVKAVGSFDSTEKTIKRIEGFPELMESTEIREMVERAKRLKTEEES